MTSSRWQFSLMSAVLVALWVSTAMWVWAWREPWVLVGEERVAESGLGPGSVGPMTPDQTRMATTPVDTQPWDIISIIDITETPADFRELATIKRDSHSAYPYRFETNDRLIVTVPVDPRDEKRSTGC